MKKNRIISALLCLSLAAGLLIPGLPAYAEGEGESGSNSGMKLSKTAVANDDGTYTITLEAYATGQKVISQVNKDVPTDIVLVLDQSGSMDDPIGTVSFEPYKDIYWYGTTYYHTRNQDHYENRHNGGNANLWHQLDDGSYVSVSVTVKEKLNPTKDENQSNYHYYKNKDYLYAKVNGEYVKVTVERSGKGDNRTYTYTLPNGIEIAKSQGWDSSPTVTGTDDNVLYLAYPDETQNVYTYTYVDADGNTQTIGTSTGANTTFPTTLYQRNINTNAGDKRIVALKSAVTTFTNSVAEKAKGADGQLGTPDDIDHRIAVVGFACSNTGDDDNYNNYQNTEVFIGSSQYRYGTAARGQYKNALQSMKTTQGKNNITASIGALAADGATYVNHGVEMANGILNANPVQAGEQRNRVVVVFTDGAPGYSGYDSDVAESAITQANTTRTLGATVYAVGIFSGADASSAGDSTGTSTQKANWFMQNLSNNKGTPRTPSYYLSAADAATLNNIFQQIADNIETGGSSTTLNETAVIKDIISPAFALPAGATASHITLETYKCTGKNGDAYIWDKNADAMGATATVNGDQVSVTGFDFADNYVGTVTENGSVSYRGNKLVISFNVSPKDGFLGGNNVYTNTSAGVYENDKATTPVLEFNRPQVNVPIKKVTVDAADKDVYLLGTVTTAQLQEGATVKVGDVPLDLSADNYGLQTWQNEYVNITVQITDEEGNVIPPELTDLKDDTTYTVTVTVSPKSTGTGASGTPATEKSGSKEANIYVYKPELTYKDSEVFYGDTAPDDTELAANLTATEWKHNGTKANTATMGPAPDLIVTYSTEVGKIANGKINSKEDIQVNATVKIGTDDVTENTTFVHTDCDPACGWKETTLDGSPAFLLHVKTATLKITKAGNVGATEGFIFNVSGPQNFRVSVQGKNDVTITGLPLGTYNVTEETGWSWRYQSVSISNNGSVNLTKDSDTATVTVTNSNKNTSLLDGNAYVQNISVPAAGN